MTDIGQKLRDGRMAAGLSLQDIADRTRIRKSYLEAMEEGQFEKLPGPVYVKGFIRQYAQAVDIDADGLIDMYRQEINEEPPQTAVRAVTGEEPRRRMDRYQKKRRRFPLRKVLITLIILLLIAGAAYFVYFLYTTLKNETIPQLREPDLVDQVDSAPDQTPDSDINAPGGDGTDLINEPEAGFDPGTEPTDEGLEPVQQPADPLTQKPDLTNETVPDSTTRETPDATVTETLPEAGLPAADQPTADQNALRIQDGAVEPVFATGPAMIEIELVVTGTCWLRVDVDGENALTENITDETLLFSGHRIRVKAGNGGAVQARQNGVLSEPFGKPGSVVTREFGE